ncbi:hypothetical protein [Leisingera aquimarina]|uniref:hypothetical protein n=1 Tax=Leisingera aquimarina TaxID=476529 RepID=UPI0012EBDADD|nr:hypothetical protein [Leisingera aquimarina]
MSKLLDTAKFHVSGTASNPNQAPTVTLDIERYQHFLEAPELSDQQKEELLKTLWSMIFCLVELGFTVCSHQKSN